MRRKCVQQERRGRRGRASTGERRRPAKDERTGERGRKARRKKSPGDGAKDVKRVSRVPLARKKGRFVALERGHHLSETRRAFPGGGIST